MKMHLATIPAEALRHKPRSAFYAGQKRLFGIVMVLLALLPLVFFGWYSASLYEESWLDKTVDELIGSARYRKELIDLFLINQEELLASVLSLHDKDTLGQERNLSQVFQDINRNGVLTDLGVIDAAGNHLAYAGPFAERLAGKNYADADWFIEVIKQGRYISDVFSGYRGVPHQVVAMAAPNRSWVLRATINSEMFNALVESTNVGPNGDAFIITCNGNFQTPSRLGRVRLEPAEVEMLQAIADVEIKTKRVGRYLYAVAPLKDEKWLLVLQTDIYSSLRELHRAKTIGLVVIAGTAILILIVAQLVIRSLVNRIEKAENQRMVLTDKVREVEKMALIGRLAATVSHEINNPLQVISAQAGWISELLDEEEQPQVRNLEEYQKAAQKIRQQVGRASTITHRLLGFSRSVERKRQETDINSLVDDTVALLESDAKKHRIAVRRNFEKNLPSPITDPSQLQQVFLNILNNAIDAIGDNGVITIKTHLANEWLLIEFADSGPGLPEENLKKIFDPFFTTKKPDKGTGLGLSISKSIMQRLGGDIQAENIKQGGCLFTITVPLNQAEHPGQA